MMPPCALAKMAENLRPSTLQWCSRRAAAVAAPHGAHCIANCAVRPRLAVPQAARKDA